MANQPQVISAEKLSALTGLSDKRHRQLAKDGYFPAPTDGEYLVSQTIAGLFKYFRENHHRQKFPVFESMAHCAASLGCPESMLKAAKRAGCGAFLTGSRVDSNELIPFLFGMLKKEDELPSGFSSWKEFREKNLALIAEASLNKILKEMMPTADAQRQAAEAMAAEYAEDVRMANEFPPAMAGQDAIAIHKRLIGWVESKWKTVRAKYNEIGK
jgi:hypothetical protein